MYLFEGKIAVKAAMFSSFREVIEILIDQSKKDRDTAFILKKAKEANIKTTRKKREEIDELCSGTTHGGICAYVKERCFQSIDEIISENCFLAIVEGVEDPFNFGFVIRSLYAAGVNALILPPRNWTSAAATLAKSSAGASELIKMCISENWDETLQDLKQRQVKIICANRDDHSICMYDGDYQGSICLCIGGEKRGLSKAILSASDQNVSIPYQNNFRNALSAASASTILAFEAMRQRNQ